MEDYKIYDITKVDPIDIEQMGTKYKFWYKNENGQLVLFKATLSTDVNGNAVQRDGEDWAEKIACEICKILGIPCANYELAINDGQRGIITENFVDSNENMQYGNSLVDNLYTALEMPPLELNQSHRIPEIITCLRAYVQNKPKNWSSLPKIKTAENVFSGYLMLDVLISNQDRHNENWGAIVGSRKHKYLAPTFDHAASLGRNESDEKRLSRLETNDKGQSISNYVKKAKSQILAQDFKRLKTIDAFYLFSSITSPDAGLSWLKRLESVGDDIFKAVIDRIPLTIMSEVSKRFSYNIIVENKKRLLELVPLLEKDLKKVSNNE